MRVERKHEVRGMVGEEKVAAEQEKHQGHLRGYVS